MSHLECESHERAFDFFRGKPGIDVDWVKLQVYGKHCVPEEFPDGFTCLGTLLQRLPGD